MAGENVLKSRSRKNAATAKADNAAGFLGGFKGRDKRPLVLSQAQLERLHRSNWICRGVCDLYARDMVSAGVVWECEPEIADFLEKSFRNLKIWSRLESCIKWARLYGGSIAFINMRDGQPEQPLNPAGDFDGLRVFDRYEVQPDTFNLIPNGPHIGEPLTYSVTPANFSVSFKANYSRVIRFLGNELPNRLAAQNDQWGDSVIQAMIDRVEKFDGATEGVAELMKRCYLRFLGIKDFWQAMSDPDTTSGQNLAQAVDMINHVQNISGLTVADATDVFSTQQYGFSGVNDVLNQFGQQIAGASGVPMVRLFGMSPAGFSTGEADLKNYYLSISAAQESALREPIGIIASVLLESNGYSTDFDFKFAPLQQPTAQEKATTAQTNINTILAVYDKGLIDEERALSEIKAQAESTGLFATVTKQDIEKAKLPDVPEPKDVTIGDI